MPPPRRLGFNALRVDEVASLTDESTLVRLAVPPELVDVYAHQPGQHLTIRANLNGQRLMRRYSICTLPGAGALEIGVKRRRGGLFSNHVADHMCAGDVLDVMTPMGGFTASVDPGAARHHVGVAVGSGITPLRSITATVLAREPRSRVTLVYANRNPRSAMFRAELDDLGRRYGERFQLVQVFSESGPETAYRGRLDPGLLMRIADERSLVPASGRWYLSGPYDLVGSLKERLVAAGAGADAVGTESFFRPEEVAPARFG